MSCQLKQGKFVECLKEAGIADEVGSRKKRLRIEIVGVRPIEPQAGCSNWFVLFVWFIWSVWFNQTNETNQINQITVFFCWRAFSAPVMIGSLR